MCLMCSEYKKKSCTAAYETLSNFETEVKAGNEEVVPLVRSFMPLQERYSKFPSLHATMVSPEFVNGSRTDLMQNIADRNSDHFIDFEEARSFLQCIFAFSAAAYPVVLAGKTLEEMRAQILAFPTKEASDYLARA